MLLIHYYQRIVNTFKSVFIVSVIFILYLFYSWINLPESSTEDDENRGSNYFLSYLPVKNYEITMVNSIFEGVNNSNQPYKITADTAVKVAEDIYELKRIATKYEFFGEDLVVNAQQARINNNLKLITLKDEVQVLLGSLECYSSGIQINFAKNKVISKEKVVILYNKSEVSADSLVANGVDNTIKLYGSVKAKVNLSDL